MTATCRGDRCECEVPSHASSDHPDLCCDCFDDTLTDTTDVEPTCCERCLH